MAEARQSKNQFNPEYYGLSTGGGNNSDSFMSDIDDTEEKGT